MLGLGGITDDIRWK